jgi:hypothetical protein
LTALIKRLQAIDAGYQSVPHIRLAEIKPKAISLMLRGMIALGLILSLIWSAGLAWAAMSLLLPRLIELV